MTTFTLKSVSYSTRYLYVTCEQIKDIANNTSTINWTLTATGGTSNYYSTGPTTLTINGEQVYYKRRVDWDEYVFPAARGSVGGTFVISHSEQGKAEVEISLTTQIGWSETVTTSDIWELDDIPRAAKITTAPAFNDEENPTITYTNYAGSAVTSLQACITLDGTNADIAYRDIPVSGGSYTFALTAAERQTLRLATLNGEDSRTLYFKIRTEIGGNSFADMKDTEFTVINAKPTLAPTAIDTLARALELTGNENAIIKGFNAVKVAANATALKGASIVSYSITNGTKALTAASGTFSNTENNVFTFKVTDNRGLTTEQALTMPMVGYVKLTCNAAATIELSGEETSKITLNINGNYYSNNFGNLNNRLTLKYAIKTNSGNYGNWVTINATPTVSNNTYKLTYAIDGLNYKNSYTVKVIASDYIYDTGVLSTEITLKTIPVFDWSGEDFNFNVPVSINGVTLDYIVEQGTANGWTYRKWNSGKGECWKTLTHTTAINTAWGNLYCGTATARQSYPFVFTAKPVETATLQSASNAAMLMAESGSNGVNGAYASACYNFVRPNSASSATFYLSLYAFGNWK